MPVKQPKGSPRTPLPPKSWSVPPRWPCPIVSSAQGFYLHQPISKILRTAQAGLTLPFAAYVGHRYNCSCSVAPLLLWLSASSSCLLACCRFLPRAVGFIPTGEEGWVEIGWTFAGFCFSSKCGGPGWSVTQAPVSLLASAEISAGLRLKSFWALPGTSQVPC